MTELVHIPFHGGDVQAASVDGKPYAIFRPIVESMGLAYASQLRRLRSKSWASAIITLNTTGADGKTYEMVAVDVRTLTMWLATIDEHKVDGSVKPLVIAYQSEVADAIESYWTKGVASRLPDDSHATRTLTLDETAAVLQQRYGLNYTVPSLARALRNCGVFKQTGAPMAKFRWWFWFTGSTWNVHPHVLVQMARRLAETEQQLRAFQGIQMRLELEGFGQVEIAPALPIDQSP